MYERRIEKLGKIEISASSVSYAQNVRYLTAHVLNVAPVNARSVLHMRQLSSAACVN